MKCKGPKWVKAWISQMAMLNDQFRDDEGKIDFLALGKEEYQYRMALIQGRLEKSERAKDAYEEALGRYSGRRTEPCRNALQIQDRKWYVIELETKKTGKSRLLFTYILPKQDSASYKSLL